MNTAKKGNEFERRALGIIQDALTAGKLGIHSSACKVFQKKGYYSKDRDSNIIFDLAIEVWPPEAKNFTLLYLIECKDYDHPVPVDDVEEFHAKIQQVSGVNAKGVFITSNKFQKGAFTYLKSKGMMLIQINFDDSYDIRLHRIQRGNVRAVGSKLEDWDDVIENFLNSVFETHAKIQGLKQLSAEQIERSSINFLEEANPDAYQSGVGINSETIITYLEKVYGIKTDISSVLGNDENGNPVLGYFEKSQKVIRIDSRLVNSERFLFTLSHEIGHAILHQNLKINRKSYDTFKDSEFNFVLGKRELKNPKNWIEWQANQFAACLILPKAALWARVYQFQKSKGIRNAGHIYYDHQPINRKDFYDLTAHLTKIFGVSYTSLYYRLRETRILEEGQQNSGNRSHDFFQRDDETFDSRRALRTD